MKEQKKSVMDFEKLKEELIRDEGLRLKPYRCSAGKLSIGVGRNLDDIGLNHKEVFLLLKSDVNKAYVAATRIVGDEFHKLTDARQRALVNMCFNLGAARFRNFVKMLIAVRLHDYEKAADEMTSSRWAKQVGDRATRLAKMMQKGE